MNSDPLTPDNVAAGTPADETTTPRRRTSRRRTAAESSTPDEATAPAVQEAPAGTRRRRSTATTTVTTPDDEASATSASPRRTRSRSTTTPSPEAPPTAPIAEDMTPPGAVDAVAADDAGGDELTAEGAPTRSRRRRRGRGGRGAATDDPVEGPDLADTALAPAVDASAESSITVALDDAAEPQAEIGLDVGAPAGRRRRRRGRGGRGAEAATDGADGLDALDELDVTEAVESFDAPSSDLAEPDLATPELEEDLSPAVLRRFDHRDWRERPARAAAPGRQERPAPAPSRDALPFRRPERGARPDAGPVEALRPTVSSGPVETSRPAASSTPLAPPRPVPGPSPLPPVTPSPIVTPSQALPAAVAAPSVPAASPIVLPNSAPAFVPDGGSTEERLERLLVAQSALMQQQQQALEAVNRTMQALQESIHRMTTTGIAAGMPRAGIFVDAPNVVYAAENARVNIDYGRMLDFLGRGREMVHAIVYAPVTEEAGYRFEGQRFVAPFLHKGYKLVTKPLKRFPDGTAKGNFDIELAIDIVTMSQRLDVVILISGDSDFSRLIELIQSRGVRVEVAAFASNVSWELVQMADVFIDIGQYLHEFRAV